MKADEWSGAASNTVDFVNLGIAGNSGPGISDGTDDSSYTFRVLYDITYLYIGVTVKDDVYVSTNYGRRLQWDLPVTWENDAVEYFFDGDLSRSAGSSRNPLESETGGQWIYGIESDDSPLPFVSPELYGEKERPYGTGTGDVWYAQTSVDEEMADWQQEARFKLSILGSPSANSQIGFNIGVDDVDTEDPDSMTPDHYVEVRDIQLYWTVFGHMAGEMTAQNTHELEELWGIIKFIEPTAGGALTITNINVNGNTLEISISTTKPSSAHAIEQASDVSAPQWTDVTNVTFSSGPGNTLLATFAKPSSSPAFYRVRVSDEPIGPACVTTPALDSWVNTPFANQTGTFTVEFDATPSADLIDGVMALSSGAQTAFTGFGCLVRFSVDGVIDARNGGAYEAASEIAYSADVKYSFRLVVNLPAHTYSVYVTPAGGGEQTVGTDFAFRTEQSTVASLNNWGATLTTSGAAGSNTVCNFRVSP